MLRFVLSALVLAGCVTPALAEYKLEIGPDTTVIDGPMNPDGTINYLAYLNEKLSEGVTPENNFAVDVARVMSESRWPNQVFQEKVHKGLGAEIPVDGPFITRIRDFIGVGEAVDNDDPRYQRWLDVIAGPWADSDHPEIKLWLDSQDELLDKIKSGIEEKKYYYFPLVVRENEPRAIDNVMLPWLGALRTIGRGFLARAEWNIAHGDLYAAWSDARVIHLLANRSMQEPYWISWLVGHSLHNMAITVIEDIAGSEKLTSDIAKQIVAETRQLGQVRSYGEVFNSGVRFSLLDIVLHYSQLHGSQYSDRDDYPGDGWLPDYIHELMESQQYDRNMTLRAINVCGDRMVRTSQIDDYHERVAAAEELERDLVQRCDRALKLLEIDPEKTRPRVESTLDNGQYSLAVTNLVVGYIFPNGVGMYKSEARGKMRLNLAAVGLAIGGYHVEHGQYPPDLNALVPEYLDSLPMDFATGELPVYRVEEGAAIVYSLGTNLKDDGGVDDNEDGDIVFRIER